jgi:type II secretory pathway component GspD/PulD (secretin)
MTTIGSEGRLGHLACARGRLVRVFCVGLLFAFAFVASGSGVQSLAQTSSARIQLVARDQPVRDVLLRLGDQAHLRITVADDVRGTVNLSLHDVTPNEALRAVCSQLRLRCISQGRTVMVTAQSSAIVSLTLVPAARAAKVLRQLFPRLSVGESGSGNTLVLAGSDSDIAAARTVVQALDVRDPTKPATEAVTLRSQPASVVADQLRTLYPSARFTVVSRSIMLVSATAADLAQIKTVVSGIDAGASPAPVVAVTNDAVKVLQRRPADVARAVGSQIPHVRVAVSGATVTLRGAPEDVARAKTLIALLDVPPYGSRYTQIYRLKNVDAASVAGLIKRAFPMAEVVVDAGLNVISVTATAAEQQRVADGVAQLDGTATSTATANRGEEGGGTAVGGVPGTSVIVQLRSIVPGYAGTTAQDLAGAVLAALSTAHPELRIIAPNGMQTLIVNGSPQAVREARELIAGLDIIPQSVALDTEILELDENSLSNLGLQLGTTSIGTTFSEVTPALAADGTAGRLIGLQALTRTPLSFQAQVNLLVQGGKARVLANPRITTLSGRTATIRAGDTISILTTVGGGTGTVATTQLESFQTGVTLDITPIITNAGELSVALHPIVNSLTGFINGVPQISTRDTQTTVHLRDNETLVIGGLIEENIQHTSSKVPLLGDLPLIGRVFRNENVTSTRNELIIVVTPHVIGVDAPITSNPARPPGIAVPTPGALPTVAPDTTFPGARPTPRPRASATPSPVAEATGASPAPSQLATPSAPAQTNRFVYGSPPASTYAAPGDAPQIFYATLTPTLFTATATVRVNAITTTNVQRVTVGSGTSTISLSQTGVGTWQGIFSANVLGLPPTATSFRLTLSASRSDGQSVSIPITVSMRHGSMLDTPL